MCKQFMNIQSNNLLRLVILTTLTSGLVSGCTTTREFLTKGTNPASIRKSYPAWVVATYPDGVTACIDNYTDILSAKKIALAKAQAKLAYQGETRIHAKQVTASNVQANNQQITRDQSIDQTIQQTTDSIITGYHVVRDAVIDLSDKKYAYCLLYRKF